MAVSRSTSIGCVKTILRFDSRPDAESIDSSFKIQILTSPLIQCGSSLAGKSIYHTSHSAFREHSCSNQVQPNLFGSSESHCESPLPRLDWRSGAFFELKKWFPPSISLELKGKSRRGPGKGRKIEKKLFYLIFSLRSGFGSSWWGRQHDQ